MVACRGHGTAATWRQAASSAIAVLCSLAGVADDGGCQTLSSLTEHPCLSRRIREGSCLWYRFQLLRLRGYPKTGVGKRVDLLDSERICSQHRSAHPWFIEYYTERTILPI